MKKFLFVFCSFLLFLSAPCFALLPEIYAQIGAGYRNDYIKWKEKDFVGDFKIQEANIIKINGALETSIFSFLLKAEADYGLVLDGLTTFKNGDSYDDSANQNTFLQNDPLDGDYVYDWSLSAGMDLAFFLPCLKVLPLIGYSYHFQKYKLDVDEDDPYLTVLQADHYESRWHGPWAGIGLNWEFWRCIHALSFTVEYQFHLADFHNNFHLDSYSYDESFHKSHYGTGNVAKANFRWIFCNGWTVSLGGVYQYWSAKRTQWESYEINLNTGYVF